MSGKGDRDGGGDEGGGTDVRNTPGRTVTSGMVGHGYYNRHSAPQRAAIDYVLPWLDAAVEALPLADVPATIGLADFGCSEGRNSIAVVQRLVTAVRRRCARPIQTVHSDLPTNDYSELFRALRPEARSVFGDGDTYSAAVGGSMYDQLLPPRSLHVATTFNAIGFLSRRQVARLPDYILPNGPSARRGVGGVSDGDRHLFATQALDDVHSLLTARAAELVPGGKLLVQVFGRSEDASTADGIYDALNDALLEIVADGIIARADYEAYYQPVYLRTLDELVAPVKAPEAPGAPSFRLDRAETYEIAVPFVETFRQAGDRVLYAREFTEFFRAFTEPVLRLSFAAHPQLEWLIGDVFDRAERLIREHPDRYDFRYIAVAMLLTRQEGEEARE